MVLLTMRAANLYQLVEAVVEIELHT